MEINIEKFLDILYSIMLNDDVSSIDIMDIVEIIKIIYSSDEFQLISSRLDINSFTEEEIANHRYTTDIDEKGIVSFDIKEKNINKILDDNKVDAGFIMHAINKRALVKYIDAMYGNNVQFKYDSSDGIYNMPYVELPDYKAQSSLFTDGENISQSLISNKDNNSCTRTVKINNSTFSLFVYYIDKIIDKIELRGKYYGDYNLLLNEAKRILSNVTESFDLVIDKNPKVYKYKKH